MRSRLKAALLLTAAFGIGIVVGASGLAVFQARSRPAPLPSAPFGAGIMLERLGRELDLSAEQRGRVEAILRETAREFATVREGMAPRVHELRQRTLGRIREVLTPSQQEKLDAFLEVRGERRGRLIDPGSPRDR